MIKLSIIIPVYNSASYLKRCVESCLKQGFAENELEILLCNDGSTDDSLAIAQQLQELHCNVHVFSQLNYGAGSARNLGLKHAKGKYVMFVDSDDYILPETIKSPLAMCYNHKLDICRFVMVQKLVDSENLTAKSNPLPSSVLYTGVDLINNRYVPLDSVCSAIFNKEFLIENNLKFSSLTSSEDVEFTLHVYLHAQRIMYDDTQVYIYEIKDNTRGHPTNIEANLNFLKNDLTIAATIKKTSNLPKIEYNTRISLLKRSSSAVTSALLSLWRQRNDISKDSALRVLDFAMSQDVYPIKGRTYTWKSSLLAHLFLNRKSLFLCGFR